MHTFLYKSVFINLIALIHENDPMSKVAPRSLNFYKFPNEKWKYMNSKIK